MNAIEVSKVMGAYAKAHAGGAFASPTRTELERHGWIEWDRTLGFAKTSGAASRRTDWLGRSIEIPAGTRNVTFLAREPGAPVPDLSGFDFVFAYADDLELTRGLAEQGRSVLTTQITAASEIVSVWVYGTPLPVDDVDCVTLRPVPLDAILPIDAMRAELVDVDGWFDDYPYYSDGSWGAVSLRGFYPDNPSLGVKPSEMSKAWKAQHPDDLDRRCAWTALGGACAEMVDFVLSVGWWRELERVRLLRMAGRGGRGGALARHTDITDKAAGTRDGQVVRFHVPLVTDPSITMRVWELDGSTVDTHLAAGEVWYLDARKPHAVANPTGVDRVHLAVDVIVDEAVREALCS